MASISQRSPIVQRIIAASQRRSWSAHRTLVSRALDDPALLALFREGRSLPESYGIGFDERVVELPWLLSHPLRGRVLDAGSALNHDHVLDRLLPLVERLHVVTLAPEKQAFTDRGVSYVYEDLRELPYRDGCFDAVVCVSTLEHVGMDNRLYSSDVPAAADPQPEADRALGELTRVLTPGGSLFVTVPYGMAEDHGWFRQYDERALQALCAAPGLDVHELRVFRYSADGWQVSDLAAAAGARYRDYQQDPSPVADRAAGARAVACLHFVRLGTPLG